MKKTYNAKISLIIGVLLMIVDQFFWTSHARILNTNNVSLLMSLLQVCHAVTLLGLDITIISLGYLYSQEENPLAEALKIWFYTIFIGIICTVAYFLGTRTIDTNAFYSLFFPIIKNVSPVISGLILSLLCYPFLKKVDFHYLKFILLSLVLLPTLGGQDLFGFGNGYSLLFTVVLFYLGVSEKKENKPFSFLSFIVIAFINILCLSLMPLCSDIVHGDMSSALRFTTSTSFFEVLIALEIVRLLRHISLCHSWSSVRFLPVASLALMGESRLSGIVSWNETHVGLSSIKLLALSLGEAFVIVALFLLITSLVMKIPAIKKNETKIDQHFRSFNMSREGIKKEKKFILEWMKKHKTDIIILVLAYLLSYISFLAMNTTLTIEPSSTQSYNIFAYIFFKRQFFILLNTFILVLVAHFLMAITRHYWVSVLLTGFIEIVVIIANYLKIVFREEPIIPADLAMIKALKSLIGMMGTGVLVLAICLIVLVIGLMIYLEKKKPHVLHMGVKKSILWILVTIIFFSGTLVMNHDGGYVNALMRGLGDEPYFFNQLYGAKVNGPVLQFLNNIDVTVMNEPQNYSEKTMKAIYEKYAKKSQQINKQRKNDWSNQIVIMGLSESFADPSRIPDLTLSQDPIPYIRSLMKTTTSGLMYSTGLGGGTANMEYMALTGLNQGNFSAALTPYTQLVPRQSYAYAFSRLFQQSVAIHPYIGVYYSRQTVYNHFGFDKFMYLGSKYPIKHQSYIDRSPYLSDETAYDNTIDEIVDAKGSKFINLVSMQNHLPYDNNVYDHKDQYSASGSAVSDAKVKSMVEEYVMGLHHTDIAVKNFIEKIDSINKPITYVFYGDHLPGIYWNTDSNKYNNVLHETDYFVYSNKYAREHLKTRSYHQYKLVSPNDFMSLIQKQTQSKTTPYTALLETVLDDLPALTTKAAAGVEGNSGAALIDENGNIVKYNDLTVSQKKLFNEYKLVQYDMTSGHNYLKKMHFLD